MLVQGVLPYFHNVIGLLNNLVVIVLHLNTTLDNLVNRSYSTYILLHCNGLVALVQDFEFDMP